MSVLMLGSLLLLVVVVGRVPGAPTASPSEAEAVPCASVPSRRVLVTDDNQNPARLGWLFHPWTAQLCDPYDGDAAAACGSPLWLRSNVEQTKVVTSNPSAATTTTTSSPATSTAAPASTTTNGVVVRSAVRPSLERRLDLLNVDAGLKLDVVAGTVPGLESSPVRLASPDGPVADAVSENSVMVTLEAITRRETLGQGLMAASSITPDDSVAFPDNRFVVTAVDYGSQVAMLLTSPTKSSVNLQSVAMRLADVAVAVAGGAPAPQPVFSSAERNAGIVMHVCSRISDSACSQDIDSLDAMVEQMANLGSAMADVLTRGSGLPLYTTVHPTCRWSPSSTMLLRNLPDADADAILTKMDTLLLQAARAAALRSQITVNTNTNTNTNNPATTARVGHARTAVELAQFEDGVARFVAAFRGVLGDLMPDFRSLIVSAEDAEEQLQQYLDALLGTSDSAQWLELREDEISYVQGFVDALPSQVVRVPDLPTALHPSTLATSVVPLLFVPGSEEDKPFLDAVADLVVAAEAGGRSFVAGQGQSLRVAPTDSFIHESSVTEELNGFLQWFNDVINNGWCVAAPQGYGCDPAKQRLVLLDYSANREAVDQSISDSGEGNNDGEPIRRSRIMLYHLNRDANAKMVLMNANIERCASPTDPRDKMGYCLYEHGAVPDGQSCHRPGFSAQFQDDTCQSGLCDTGNVCSMGCVPFDFKCDSDCVAQAEVELAEAKQSETRVTTVYNNNIRAEAERYEGNLANLRVVTYLRAMRQGQYACERYMGAGWEEFSLQSTLNGDTNQNSGGWTIFICQRVETVALDAPSKRYLVDLQVNVRLPCPQGWDVLLFTDGAIIDLNKEAGGADVFLCMRFMTLSQIIATQTWPIENIFMARNTNSAEIPPGYTFARTGKDANGDLAQGAGGYDKYLFYKRSTAVHNEVDRHALTVERLTAQHDTELAQANAVVRIEEQQLEQAKADNQVSFCPELTVPTGDSDTCPCKWNNPCDNGGTSASASTCDPEYQLCHVTSLERQTFTCVCRPGWAGPDCKQTENCNTNPCATGEYCTMQNRGPDRPPRRECRPLSLVPPGFHVVTKSTSVADRVVEPCPAGTFQPFFGTDDTTSCDPHQTTSCGCGRRMSSTPTPYNDGVCTMCKPNEYQPSRDHTLTTCIAAEGGNTPAGSCSAPSTSRSNDDHHHHHRTLIIVLAVLLPLIFLLVLCCCCVWYRRNHNDDHPIQPPPYTEADPQDGGWMAPLKRATIGMFHWKSDDDDDEPPPRFEDKV